MTTDNYDWIAVSEQMPEKIGPDSPYSVSILVYDKHSRSRAVGYYYEYTSRWYDSSDHWLRDVTHWQPLPKPPA